MNVTDSEQRRNKILEIVIDAYITTATPVGSELISRKLRSSLSPATIRHIMVALEKDGLLEQPHTSAGRVPTDHGYRVYVDSVMERRPPSPEELRQLELLIDPHDEDLERLLERASAALAHLSQEAAFVVAPTVKQSRVKQIELVPVSVRKLLCVLIANEEMVASRVVEVEEPMSRDEMGALVRFLNAELTGVSCDELLDSLERRLLAERDSVYHLIRRSLSILQHVLSVESEDRLLLEGVSYVVSQPEFSRHPDKAHELLRHLEAQQEFVHGLRQDLVSDGVRVRIGREILLPAFASCSYVAAPFAIEGELVGGIGVLGPTRMPYARLQGLVGGMAKAISGWLTRWGAA